MRIRALGVITLLFGLAVPSAVAGQSSTPPALETVVVPSGPLRLTGLLWKPSGSGPFPAVLFSHGGGRDPGGAQAIGPVFARHGYVFLYLFRRGHGPSAAQGEFMGDVTAREATEEARRRLQLALLTTDHLDDVNAGLAFLKDLRSADPGRLAVAGHSAGGQLALFAAENDSAIRAAITFAAAAQGWEGSPELRERLLITARNVRSPVLLMHAANDFSTAPAEAIAEEMKRLKKPHQLKIYPPVGETAAAGHQAVYTDVQTWENDVFSFLDEHMRPLAPSRQR
jgi:carboxymethylenebutenolidase